MTAVQLTLQFAPDVAQPASTDEVVVPVKNPCLTCEFRGLCSEGECGAHMFPLDMDKKPVFGHQQEKQWWEAWNINNDLIDFD